MFTYGKSILVGPEPRAEDPAKWAVTWLDEDFLCKRYGCTVAQLNAWSHKDCPLALPLGKLSSEPRWGANWAGKKRSIVRDMAKVLEVEARWREIAPRLPKQK